MHGSGLKEKTKIKQMLIGGNSIKGIQPGTEEGDGYNIHQL
jgi:hypothetical protein